MTISDYCKEAHERHMTFLAALSDFLDALDRYEQSLFGHNSDNYTEEELEAMKGDRP